MTNDSTNNADHTLRQRLLDVVTRIEQRATSKLVEEFTRLCPHPGGSDILFWPNHVGLCRDEEIATFKMTAEEIVDFALSWQPATVAMTVAERIGGIAVGYYQYKLTAPGYPPTTVATSTDIDFSTGEVVAVALKGVELPDGQIVDVNFRLKCFSCGMLLGICDAVPGTQLKLSDWLN